MGYFCSDLGTSHPGVSKRELGVFLVNLSCKVLLSLRGSDSLTPSSAISLPKAFDSCKTKWWNMTELVENIEKGIMPMMARKNPFRPQLIRLLNLQCLMEFCIPVIQDYGVAIKGNDYLHFEKCLYAIVAFFVMCNAQGSLDYRRSLYCFLITTRYWTFHQLPIMPLLRANHTLFSEESGEIALSALATSQPTSNCAKYHQVRKDWQLVRSRFVINRPI